MGVPRPHDTARAVGHMTEWIDAGPLEPTHPDEVRTLTHEGRLLAVAHTEGRWYAFDDVCPHHDCPLADGYLAGTTIECDCHGSVFELTTGQVRRGPATSPIAVHEIDTHDGRLRICVQG